jgi:hypothetical protein
VILAAADEGVCGGNNSPSFVAIDGGKITPNPSPTGTLRSPNSGRGFYNMKGAQGS